MMGDYWIISGRCREAFLIKRPNVFFNAFGLLFLNNSLIHNLARNIKKELSFIITGADQMSHSGIISAGRMPSIETKKQQFGTSRCFYIRPENGK
jgi:hypothetical protein